jgi:hypothetical protein
MDWLLIAILGLSEASVVGADLEYVPGIWAPPASYPATLRDIAGRLPERTDAKDPDLITYAHEGNHFLCRGKAGYHGVYVGNGLRIFLPTPPLVTANVLLAVPEHKRGTIFQTYLSQSRSDYWAAQPLMILDEWAAYIAGSKARSELLMTQRRESTVHCATFATYAETLCRLARDCDGYPVGELRTFCKWQLARCREIIPDWDQLSDVTFD